MAQAQQFAQPPVAQAQQFAQPPVAQAQQFAQPTPQHFQQQQLGMPQSNQYGQMMGGMQSGIPAHAIAMSAPPHPTAAYKVSPPATFETIRDGKCLYTKGKSAKIPVGHRCPSVVSVPGSWACKTHMGSLNVENKMAEVGVTYTPEALIQVEARKAEKAAKSAQAKAKAAAKAAPQIKFSELTKRQIMLCIPKDGFTSSQMKKYFEETFLKLNLEVAIVGDFSYALTIPEGEPPLDLSLLDDKKEETQATTPTTVPQAAVAPPQVVAAPQVVAVAPPQVVAVAPPQVVVAPQVPAVAPPQVVAAPQVPAVAPPQVVAVAPQVPGSITVPPVSGVVTPPRISPTN